MKYIHLFISAVLMTMLLSACKKENNDFIPTKCDGVYGVVEQPEMVWKTKSLKDDKGIKFFWKSGEKIGIFDENNTLAYHPLTEIGAKENVGRFDPKGFLLRPEKVYYSFLPSTIGNSEFDTKDSILVSFAGQCQISNGNTDHLKNFGYAVASAKAKETGSSCSCEFNYKNQVCWIKVSATFDEDVKGLKKFTLTLPTTSGRLFTLTGLMDATKDGSSVNITPVTQSRSLTLELGSDDAGIDVIAGDTVIAYFTMLPTDLTSENVTLTATSSNGEFEIYSFTPSVPFERNGCYSISKTAKAYVAKVGEKGYFTLVSAISAAQTGDTVTIITSGDYPSFPSIIRTGEITVRAAENITVNVPLECVSYSCLRQFKNVILEGINFDMDNNVGFCGFNYGMSYPSKVKFKNCSFNKLLFTYGTQEFEQCNFSQDGDNQYCIYTYGIYSSKDYLKFDRCKFENSGKSKFINAYTEEVDSTLSIFVNSCTFNNKSNNKGKAAVLIKEKADGNYHNFKIYFTGTNHLSGPFPTGKYESEVTAVDAATKPLWAVEGEVPPTGGCTISVKGKKVYPVE